MKLKTLGSVTSDVEVTNISKHGLWVLLGEEELFLPFSDFPWFKHAEVSAILNVELPGPNHLYWPDLDVDLTVESIRSPDKYPLISKVGCRMPLSGRISKSGSRGAGKTWGSGLDS